MIKLIIINEVLEVKLNKHERIYLVLLMMILKCLRQYCWAYVHNHKRNQSNQDIKSKLKKQN